jgi:precorrin-3B synthase
VGNRSIRAVPTPSLRRTGADACPGALRLHAAADGPLARVRVPGGLLTGAQLRVLRALAQRWGDGRLELTSRGNVQLRALTGAPATALAEALAGAGLLPSRTHETVRNIAASPLPSRPDVRPLVRALDAALCADPRLAELPGRFLFALDTGARDVAASADAAAVAVPPSPASASSAPGGPSAGSASSRPGGHSAGVSAAVPIQRPPGTVPPGGAAATWAVLVGGADLGLRVAADRVVPALLAVAHAFLDERAARQQPAWRVAELDDGPATVAARAAALLGLPSPTPPTAAPPTAAPPSAAPPTAAPPTAAASTAAPPTTTAKSAAPPTAAPPTPWDESGGSVPPLVGVLRQADGRAAVGATVPLGRLDGVPLEVLEAADHLVVTPWRGVLVPDLPPSAAASWLAALRDAGLAVDPGSRWSGVSACAGRPGCAKSLADVRADADTATVPGGGLPVHWVGCARGCGSPGTPHVRVEATPRGYRVTAPALAADATVGELAALVAAARRG